MPTPKPYRPFSSAFILTLVITAAKVAAAAPGLQPSVCTLAEADRATTDSLACLSCHDGSVSPDIPAQSGPRRPHRDSHPVGMTYGGATRMHLRSVAALPDAIVLVDGRVTCTTCHDGESSSPAHLAITQGQRSALCMACHRM